MQRTLMLSSVAVAALLLHIGDAGATPPDPPPPGGGGIGNLLSGYDTFETVIHNPDAGLDLLGLASATWWHEAQRQLFCEGDRPEDDPAPRNTELSVAIWDNWSRFSDGIYITSHARVNLATDSGNTCLPNWWNALGVDSERDDIEYVDLTIPAPHESCRLQSWAPTLNGQGRTIAAGLNLDGDAGINVGMEFTVGVDGTEVEAAPMGLRGEDAHWYVDFDDAGNTANHAISLIFSATWRCPADVEEDLGPFVMEDLALTFEVDDPLSDVEYEFSEGGLSMTDADGTRSLVPVGGMHVPAEMAEPEPVLDPGHHLPSEREPEVVLDPGHH